jgi:3-deoxy-D-manno-octulosonate 8-phosphate phosphatase (KDO 8-P phosphatase)
MTDSYVRFPFDLAAGVRMLVLDVDGVMTAGQVVMDDHGMESKAFNVRDGHGLKMLQRAGIQTAILTGRTSGVVEHRAKDLGIEHVLQGSLRKTEGLDQLCKQAGVAPEDCAYMGDDIVDLPAMRRCQLMMCPADAHIAIAECVHWVAGFPGGQGAVRQAAEGLILAAGVWQKVVTSAYGLSPADCGWSHAGN